MVKKACYSFSVLQDGIISSHSEKYIKGGGGVVGLAFTIYGNNLQQTTIIDINKNIYNIYLLFR